MMDREIWILAQNFANDAVKAGENLAEEIPRQGQKLGEQAFELGKEKGIYLHSPAKDSYHHLFFQRMKHSKLLNKPVSTFILFSIDSKIILIP